MSIHVKYFASLRETIGRSHDEITFTNNATVEEVWIQATQNMQRTNRLLVAVCDEDEVAFFPPVTGG